MNLDSGGRFDRLYADRTRSMRVSATKELVALRRGPGIVSLAGGSPEMGAFAGDALRKMGSSVVREATTAFQYGPTEGMSAVRDDVVEAMNAVGAPARSEDVLLTNGGQQVLDLMGRVFLNEGDAVLVESPTYYGALNAFAAYRPRILGVPVDDEGMDVAAAREVLERARKIGTRVKFVYTIPNFQNPTGVTMTLGRRRELIELARDFGLPILEDDAYGMLRYEGESVPTLSALEQEEIGGPGRVAYLGTFSKVFSPGVRLGWVHAHPEILRRMRLAKQGADLGPSSLSQTVAVEFFRGGQWREHVRKLVGIYRERRDAMLDALAEFMPEEVSWTRPEGGFFVWVTLPESIDASAILPEAVGRGVAYVPGEDFYADGVGGKNRLRLSFSFAEPRLIWRGVRVLAGTVRDQMEIEGIAGRDLRERAYVRG
jgi:2-aminoadipate transaminase